MAEEAVDSGIEVAIDVAIDAEMPMTELARLAVERAEGNLDEAARLLEGWAAERVRLRDALTRPFLTQACYQAVVAASWHERRVHWKPPGSAEAGAEEGSGATPEEILSAPSAS